jgi:hypothetical protein
MENDKKKCHLSLLITAAALWGVAEAIVGMFLRGSCARTITGSLMTGVALFFCSLGISYMRKTWSPFIMLTIVILFKSLDAFLLHLPFKHGAVANPVFAFITEVCAIIFVVSIVSKKLQHTLYGKSLVGGLSALVAINLFPLVKYFSGIPACVYPGTQYPLALYFAPISIGISLITVPLGFIVGEQLYVFARKQVLSKKPRIVWLSANSLTIISFAVMIFLRVI